MGLRERQLIRMHQEETLPALTNDIKTNTGGLTVEWDVDWSSFEPSEYALQNVQHQGFGRINDAIRVICYNDYGKEAVREGLKTIRVKNVDSPSAVEVGFDKRARALIVDGAWGGEDSSGWPQDTQIQHVLEDNL